MFVIEEIKKQYEDLLNQLSDSELVSDWEKFEELAKRKNFLEKIIEKEREIQELKNKIEENKTILKSKEDAELFSLAETEISQLGDKLKNLEKELKKLLFESGKKEKPQSVIVEIRAGTGGKEAALFTADLFKMYVRYAENKGWKQKTLDIRPTELKGLKEIIFEIKGENAWPYLQYEGGVHRVQRVPMTEKSGRIHTSTVTVAILPKAKKMEINIRPEDLKIDFYRASGPGGQYVNKRETAVRITHLSTGIVVTSQTERNQLQNKENALTVLEARLLARKKEEEVRKIGGERKTQIGQAKRAEKIRTYNFPQNRVTDHRIKKSFHDIEGIMDGKLEPIIKSLAKSL